MFCINCGVKLPEGAKFCMACGTKVVGMDTGSSATATQDRATDITIKQSRKKEPIEFTVSEEAISFDGAFRKYTADRSTFVSKFNTKIENATAEVRKEFQKCIETEKDKCLELLASYGEKLINWTCDWGVDFLIKNGVYDVSRVALMPKCAVGFQVFYDRYSKFEEGYLSIVATAEQMEEYRKLRHASRGRWQGGGFGVAGAIKGAATAGALNLGGSIISGIGSAISGAIDRNVINKKKATYLNSHKWVDEMRGMLTEGAESTFVEIYKLLSQKTAIEMPQLSPNKANTYFENSRKAGSPKQTISVILKGLREYPYNEKGYRLLLEQCGTFDLDVYRMIEYFLPKEKWNATCVLLKETYSRKGTVLPNNHYERLDADISFMNEKIEFVIINKEKMQFFANYAARYMNDDKKRLEQLLVSRCTAQDGTVCASVEDLNIYLLEQPTYETYRMQLLDAPTLQDKLEVLQQAKAEKFKSEALSQKIEEDICNISSKIQDANDFMAAKQRLEETNGAEELDTIIKIAGRGLEDAQIYLGELYLDTDPCKAVFWFQRAANQKSMEGRARLGCCYFTGNGIAKNEDRGYALLSESAKAGSAFAQHALGCILCAAESVSDESLNKYGDKKAGLKWLHTAAENGYSEAQRDLGYMYETGAIAPTDYEKAMQWYRKGAEQGEPVCQRRIGQLYKDGKGVQQDYAEAARWYRLGAESGDTDCQFWLGWLYREGHGVQKDYAEAAKWYRLGAENGDKYCQFQIGEMYRTGMSVQQDYAEAAKWYLLGAESGHVRCQFWIGSAFEKGNGVPQDYTEAAKWYQKAANQGNSSAMNNLALLYEYGKGVTKDHKKALALLKAAMAAGNEMAKKNYKSIKRFFD